MRKRPLLSSQKRFWFEWKLNPYSIAYNMNFLFKIRGNLQLGRLHQAIHSLGTNHPILKTTFIEEADGNVFYIQSANHAPELVIKEKLSLFEK